MNPNERLPQLKERVNQVKEYIVGPPPIPEKKVYIVADPEDLAITQARLNELNDGIDYIVMNPHEEAAMALLRRSDNTAVDSCHTDANGNRTDARGTGPGEDYSNIPVDEWLRITARDQPALLAMAEAMPEMRAERAEVEKFVFDDTFLDSTPNKDRAQNTNRQYAAVVWHATVSKVWRTNVFSVINFLLRKSSAVSYNQVIPSHKVRGENRIYNLVSKLYVAWHAGKSRLQNPWDERQTLTNYQVNVNTYGIAIDHSNSDNDAITQHHFNGMVAAALNAKRKYGIPLDIRFHKLHMEVAPGRKFDITKKAVLISRVLQEAQRIEAEQNNKPVPEKPADPRLGPQEISEDRTNIRRGPSTAYKIVDKVNKGTQIFITRIVQGEAYRNSKDWGQLSTLNPEDPRYVHSLLYSPRKSRVQALLAAMEEPVEKTALKLQAARMVMPENTKLRLIEGQQKATEVKNKVIQFTRKQLDRAA